MEVHPAVVEALERLGADYEILPCDPRLADTVRFCEAYGFALEDSANTILVASKRPPGRLAACVVLASTRLDVNHTVKAHLGVRRLSFASPETTLGVTGMEIGGVTPFGLSDELPLLIDARVPTRESVILGAGTRTAKIRCHPQVLTRLPSAEVVEGLAYVP